MMKKYIIPYRLADVITLLSVLSVDKGTYRTREGLDGSIRTYPQSGLKTWFEVAEAHPEFFKFNEKKDHVALRLRSYFEEGEDSKRPPLSVAETQKIIETAITLHEKEIEYKQRNSHLFPIIVAFIALGGVVFSTLMNNSANSKVEKKLDSISVKVDTLNLPKN